MTVQQPARQDLVYFRDVFLVARPCIQHPSLDSFHVARKGYGGASSSIIREEFSLVLVSSGRRVLLEQKRRPGFGEEFFLPFLRKVVPGESCEDCARRTWSEEINGTSNTTIPVQQTKHGWLKYTCQNDSFECLVHIFRFDSMASDVVACDARLLEYVQTFGNDQTMVTWFNDYGDIPAESMSAIDSLWLARVLSTNEAVHAWFHIDSSSKEIYDEDVLHCYLDFLPSTDNSPLNNDNPPTYSLAQRLFHALHDKRVRSPNIKEFNESLAFVNAVQKVIRKSDIDIVIDVAGGHGALGALFLILTGARESIVIDPANVGNGGVERAWKLSFFPHKRLHYRYECLRTALPNELEVATNKIRSTRVLVVACHACQHLSEEIVEISCRHGVHCAVMPCCQKDSMGGWKDTSKNINIPISKVMDLLLAGKAMSWAVGSNVNVQYDVRMKVIDGAITPQNRIIVCRACEITSDTTREERNAQAHQKLQQAYKRAHVFPLRKPDIPVLSTASSSIINGGLLLGTGFMLGIIASTAFLSERKRR